MCRWWHAEKWTCRSRFTSRRLNDYHAWKGKLTVTVDTQLFRGVHYEIICFDEQGNEWMVHSTRKAKEGAQVGLSFEPEDIHVMRFNESEEDFDARLESYDE